MRALPVWGRVLGLALALLVINLFWNDPLRAATGGGAFAFLALNLLPSLLATAWMILGGESVRALRSPCRAQRLGEGGRFLGLDRPKP